MVTGITSPLVSKNDIIPNFVPMMPIPASNEAEMCGGLEGEALREREEKRLTGRRRRKEEEEGVEEAAEVERSLEVEMVVEREEIAIVIEREREQFSYPLPPVKGDGI